jgi:hypothetical protein
VAIEECIGGDHERARTQDAPRFDRTSAPYLPPENELLERAEPDGIQCPVDAGPCHAQFLGNV